MDEQITELNKIAKENLEIASKLYLTDNKEGNLLPSLLKKVKDSDEDLYNKLYKMLVETDPKIFKKNNMVQKIIFNKILLTHVLKIRAIKDIDVNNMVTLLSNSLKDNIWKNVIIKHILPTLRNNQFI